MVKDRKEEELKEDQGKLTWILNEKSEALSFMERTGTSSLLLYQDYMQLEYFILFLISYKI